MNIPSIQLSPGAKAIMARWETMPANVLQAIAAGMDYQNQLTLAHIVRDSMSFPKDGPAMPIGTRVQTNRLRGSMRASKARIEGQTVASGIGSNVEHAAAMEFGSAPHRIEAKNGKALRFFAGKPVFCKWVNHPGTQPREFTQRGIADTMPDYGRQISKRIIAAMKGTN
jgi:hypothetical protein